MDKETYSDADVISYSNKTFVNVKLDGDKEKDMVQKLGANGFPNTVIMTPAAEIVGRIVGFVGPKDYVEKLKKMGEAYLKLQGLLEKAKKDPADFAAAKAVAEVYKDLENGDAAYEWYKKVADGVSAKKEKKDDDKKLLAQTYVSLMDILLNQKGVRDEATTKDLQDIAKKAKENDPENKYDSLDDALAMEAVLLIVKKDFDGAVKAAADAYAKYAKSDKADMLLFVVAIGQEQGGKHDDAKKSMKELADKFPETQYGKMAKQYMEYWEKQGNKKEGEKEEEDK